MVDHDEYLREVMVNQAFLDEELSRTVNLAQGAMHDAWDNVLSLPESQREQALVIALDAITREHGQSAMVAAQDNMQSQFVLWARERGSQEGIPRRPADSYPLGEETLRELSGQILERHRESGDDLEGRDAFSRIVSSVVMNRARNVVVNTCKKANVRYYRMPEPGACPFCLMLASRGAVYHSEHTAGDGNRYHAHCRCSVRPRLRGEPVPKFIESLHDLSRKSKFAGIDGWKKSADSEELTAVVDEYVKNFLTDEEIRERKLRTPAKRELYFRQKRLRTPIPRGMVLDGDEVDFLGSFERLGEQVEWLPEPPLVDRVSRRENESLGARPSSNRFIWHSRDGQEYALKSPRTVNAEGASKSTEDMIRAAAKGITRSRNKAYSNWGFGKTRFVVDLGSRKYNPKYARILQDLNQRSGAPEGIPPIETVVVYSAGEFIEIDLQHE